MIKRICDRCNKEIKDNWWIIDIYEKQDTTGRVSTMGAVNNMQQNLDKMLNKQEEYCKSCIEEIKATIKRRTNET